MKKIKGSLYVSKLNLMLKLNNDYIENINCTNRRINTHKNLMNKEQEAQDESLIFSITVFYLISNILTCV